MAVKEVCDAGYVIAQCRCMQEIHGSVRAKPCEHKSHDGMVRANENVLRAAGLTPITPEPVGGILVSPPASDVVPVTEWKPTPSFFLPTHKSQTSGFDGRTQFWRCSCGWEVHVPITSEQSAEQHQAAINVTFGAFQAHKIASNGHG